MNNTMKLEQQVVSLELAKKLKELGVRQDSLFYWYLAKNVNNIDLEYRPDSLAGHPTHKNNYCSAFTVAELGEMLPRRITKARWTWICFKDAVDSMDIWNCILADEEVSRREVKRLLAETEADARAKMLIWLIEEGYITQ